jgi:hypothetical protein
LFSDPRNARSFISNYLPFGNWVLNPKNEIIILTPELLSAGLRTRCPDVIAHAIINNDYGKDDHILIFIEEQIKKEDTLVLRFNDYFFMYYGAHKKLFDDKMPYPICVIINPDAPWDDIKTANDLLYLENTSYHKYLEEKEGISDFVVEPGKDKIGTIIRYLLFNLRNLPPNIDDILGTDEMKLILYSLKNRIDEKYVVTPEDLRKVLILLLNIRNDKDYTHEEITDKYITFHMYSPPKLYEAVQNAIENNPAFKGVKAMFGSAAEKLISEGKLEQAQNFIIQVLIHRFKDQNYFNDVKSITDVKLANEIFNIAISAEDEPVFKALFKSKLKKAKNVT